MVALGDDLDCARSGRARPELFGRVEIARLTIAAEEQRRAHDPRRELEEVGKLGQQVEKARGAGDVPPAGQEHELTATAGGDQPSRLRRDFVDAIARQEPCLAGASDQIRATAVRGEQDERGGRRLIDDMADREQPAMAVADDDGMRKTACGQPLRGRAIVGDRLAGRLECRGFRLPTVADAEDVMAAAVEGQAGDAHLGETRREEARGSDVEVHGVAVEEQRGSHDRAARRLGEDAVERLRVGGNADERRAQRRYFSASRICWIFSFGTAIFTPARSTCSSIETRESRSLQPRLSASVSSSSARWATRMGTRSSRPSSVASVTSLWARRSVKSGGSYVPGRNGSRGRSNVRRRPSAPCRTACHSASGSTPPFTPSVKTSASAAWMA